MHIPIGDHSATHILYEFVPAPIRLASHPQLFSVHPYRIHIAVGTPDNPPTKNWRVKI